MRFVPRIAYSENVQVVSGFTLTDIEEITSYALRYKQSGDGVEIIHKIRSMITASVRNNYDRNAPQEGIYRGRGDEVTLVLERSTDYLFHNIETLASLFIYDQNPNNNDGEADDLRTPEMISMHRRIQWADKFRDQPRLDKYSLKNKPLSTLRDHEIKKRREEAESSRRFHAYLRDLFKRP
jgi:hypothetical protein